MSIGADWGAIDDNRNPNLVAARAAGVTFGIRKLYQSPYGGDVGFAAEWAAMRAADIVRGCYLFPDLRPTAIPARAQVDAAAAELARAGGLAADDMAPAMDVEFPGGKLPRRIYEIVSFLEDFARAMFDVFGCWSIVYTSQRVWDGSDTDALRAPHSWIPDRCPLWVKTAYVRSARQPVAGAPMGRPRMPLAWAASSSPGAWINQFQGDAIGVPGFTSTVDVNRWLFLSRATATAEDAGRVAWVQRKLGVATSAGTWDDATEAAVRELQGEHADGIIGPHTFALLSRLPTPA
jgi:hypothetical protein